VAGAALLGRLRVPSDDGRSIIPLGTLTPLRWLLAELVERVPETPRVASLVLDVPGWAGHRPGQHVDVRLTAEDGYQAQRSYSIASAPEDPGLELTVERINDGEVSPYLVDELRPGDQFELRGPIGGYFTWNTGLTGPLLLVGGGSGVVPLRAMLRHREAAGGDGDARLLLSARAEEDVLYRSELDGFADDGVAVHLTLTRSRPAGWTGFARRVDAEMLAAVGPPASERPRIYVCGPTPFVESAADLLVDLGHDPAAIHAERFGPTGG
jgi:ferredoxin-NADP reductase